MKNISKFFLLQLFLFISVFSVAQPPNYSTSDKKAIKNFESATQAFDAGNFDLALLLTKEAIDRDENFTEAYLLQFEIYSDMRNPKDAEISLSAAMEMNPEIFPNGYFFLGDLQMRQGNYKDAEQNFQKFIELPKANVEMRDYANKQLRNCEFAIPAMENPVPFDPKNMGPEINSEDPEYYPCLTADDGIFLFTRLIKDRAAHGGRNEDFFISARVGEKWKPAQPLYSVNTPFNEGAPTISADGRLLVFTACEVYGEYGPGRSGFGSCDLFYAMRVGNNWTQPRNMGAPVNTTHWETQPSLSADGRTLYFIRGMSSRQGIQNQDIYFSIFQKDSTWSTPVPLPGNINTTGREESVQIHPDGRTLYFSSDGHPGMGGLDIYLSRLNDDATWEDPVNLGYPINTYGDENSLTVSTDGLVAFIASDREGGMGDLDLYQFDLYPEIRPTNVIYAKGLVYDRETKKPIGANFELMDLQTGEVVVSSSADSRTGQFLVTLPVNRDYALNASSPGYLFFSEHFSLKDGTTEKAFAFDVPLSKIKAGEAVVLRNIFFDTDKYVLKDDSKTELNKLIDFLKENPEVRIEVGGHTDNQGDPQYNLSLSQNRAEAVKNYLVENGIEENRLKSKGYGMSKPLTDNSSEEDRALNRRTEFMVIE